MKKLGCAALAVALGTFAASAAITGSVVRPDGMPITGARVAVYAPIPPQWMLQDLHRTPLASSSTDKDGNFSLDTAVQGVIDIHIESDDLAPLDFVTVADEPIGALTLTAARTVTGKVTAEGQPASGATVFVIPASGRAFATKTDATGTYRVADPANWARAILVMYDGFAPAWHLASALDFALDRGRDIRGKVVDESGRPAAGATVEVNQLMTVMTADDGLFVVRHAPRDLVLLSATTKTGKATMTFNSGTATLKLKQTFSVSGTIHDTEKRPVSGLAVAIGGGGESAVSTAVAVTDTNGSFSFNVPAGQYEIGITDTSNYSEPEIGAVEVSRTAVKKDIIAQRLSAIAGVVIGDDDKPAAAANILLLYTDKSSGSSALYPTSVISGRDGTFRVRALNDNLRIVALKSGLPPAISEPITAKTHSVTLKIAKGITVAGVVVGPDKQPVAGVHVSPVVASVPATQTGATAPPPWITTDAQGHFTGSLTSATNALSFDKTGFMDAQQVVEVRDGMHPMTVTLRKSAIIAGRVVNADGTPAADIAVEANAHVVSSRADGTFQIDGVEPGEQIVHFGRRSFAKQTVRAPISDLKLTLPASKMVRGRVLDPTGAPVEAFTVSVIGDDSGSMHLPAEGSNGEFELEAPVQNARLRASASGYASTTVPVEPTSDKPLVITLSRGRTARGHVVDEKSQPVAGVSISTNSSDAPPANIESQPDGSFEVAGLPNEEVRISFRKEGYVSLDRKVGAGRDDAAFKVTLTPGLVVTGRVVDRNGSGVPEVSVSATSAAHGVEMSQATTDSTGAFRFDDLGPARYDFEVARTEDGKHGALKDVDVEKVHEIAIHVDKTPTAVIYGHVTGADTNVAARFVTIATDSDEFANGVIDAAGNFRIENAPSGTLQVQAMTYGGGGNRQSKAVTVDAAAGSETRVDLLFSDRFKIHGNVTRGGEPVAGMSVQFSGRGSALSGADGTYEVLLDSGEYDVTMTAGDGRPIPFGQHVTVTGAAEFDFRIDVLTVAARVVDASSGEPVSGASVSVSHHGETHRISTVQTAADGVAQIDVLRGALVTLVASKGGYANASTDVTPTDNEAVTLRLARSAGAVVRLVDQRDGRTLSGYVIARDAAGRVVASVTEADDDGTATLPVAEGHYSFSGSAEGFGSATISADVPGAELRIPLPRGGNLSLRATDEVRGSARLIQPDGQEYVRCWCSGIAEIKIEGRTTLVDRIAPGAYMLEVTLADQKPKRVPVTVIEGQTTAVTIE